MASDKGLQSKIFEISKHIEELQKQSLDDPDKVTEALAAALEELEIRVKERTAELEKANRTLQEEVAERKETEAAVKAERQRFNDVLETLPAYLVLLTPDYHVPFANRFFRERFGESNGRRCFEYLFGRSEPCEICETYTVPKTNEPHRWEWTGPDGHNYDIFDFPFTDTDGSALIMEMGIDITERRHAEEALRVAGAYNRSLIEASLDPLVTIGPDGKITDVNAATEVVTGYSREELIGTDFSNYFTEPNSARAGYQQVFQEGFVRDYALEIQRRDGHITPVLYNASVYRDDAGHIIGVFASARDITERKRAEETLRVRALQQEVAAQLGLQALAGPDLTILMNEAVSELAKTLGVEYTKVLKLLPDGSELLLVAGVGWKEGLVGRGTVGSGRDSQAGYTLLSSEPVIVEDLRTETRFSGPPLLHEHGVISGMSVIISGHGRPFGVLGVHTVKHRTFTADDVHFLQAIANLIAMVVEQKRVEAELEKYREHLEELVQERTGELEAANEELQAENTERAEVEDALARERANLQTIFDIVNVGMLLIEENGAVRRINNTVSNLVGKKDLSSLRGHQPGDLLGCIHAVNDPVGCGHTPHCRACPIRDSFEAALLSGQSIHGVETEATLQINGDRIHLWLEASIDPLILDGKQHAIMAISNITRRKQEEEQLRKLNRTLRALSNSNQALMHALDESTYLQDVCKIIVEDCGHAMVWIGYAEEDEVRSVRPVAYAGFEGGYLERLNITWADSKRGRGPTGTAIRTGKQCVCRNILTDPLFAPWREEAIRRGYASSIVLPLLSGGKAFGAINIYSRQPDPFSEDEAKLLRELASDLAYGIASLRMRAAHARAEEALHETRDYLENLIDYANAPIIVWDPSFKITRFNHAFERLTGLKADEALGSSLDILFPKKGRKESLNHIERALSGERWESVEIPILRTNGSQRTVLWNSANIHGKEGRVIATIAQGQDITERKQAEEELRRARDELDLRVQERTAELSKANEELENLYKQIQSHSTELEHIVAERTKWLEAANKELESFSYSVSHDLRAPLRAMDGFSRILLEEYSSELSPEGQRYLQLVRGSAQQMGRLIDDLLAFSRLGRQTLDKRRVMPIDLVDNVLEEMKGERTGRQIDIVVGDLPACEADPTLLRQVFINLISNALKFTRKRETARIEVGSQQRNGKVVYFIKDNGAGFDMKYVHKLFGVFQRLHSADEYEGTGVGLANVQRIIHRHGGSIWADGAVDKGATFYFTLDGGVLK